MLDGLIFGAGYYTSDIPESDVIFAVSNAIRTYETNRAGDAWIDIITPDAPIRTDALYPFVIDAGHLDQAGRRRRTGPGRAA